MKLRYTLAAAALGALMAAVAPALAQHNHGQAAMAQSGGSAELADGELRRIDATKGTVLLKHGEIKSINMGAMSMTFKLKEPTLATGLKVGDKVRFAAEQQGGQLIVTRIEKVR